MDPVYPDDPTLIKWNVSMIVVSAISFTEVVFIIEGG
jgi:hypothetical protein